ncbi:hypothetical protein CEXT_647131 [Caerostris extrusa]|uniref:Uncharacterized protein n=1 Tax=Caerostris extrusa TaxID=172846 RepID=A0AAV4R3G4_CAEEX|nr:hypothetical protein CEXT_647131 [Caerostris extrusa]
MVVGGLGWEASTGTSLNCKIIRQSSKERLQLERHLARATEDLSTFIMLVTLNQLLRMRRVFHHLKQMLRVFHSGFKCLFHVVLNELNSTQSASRRTTIDYNLVLFPEGMIF